MHDESVARWRDTGIVTIVGCVSVCNAEAAIFVVPAVANVQTLLRAVDAGEYAFDSTDIIVAVMNRKR
jgi:hypothetical protein